MIELNKKTKLTLLVFLLVFSAFAYTAFLQYNYTLSEDQIKAKDSLLYTKSVLENILTAHIISTKGLISYIQTSPDLNQENFEVFAKALVNIDEGIVRNIAILENTTIRYTYPLKGNEKSIGVDIAKIREQADTILEARKTGKMVITAPVNLVQGGTGIIVRMPIYKWNPYTKNEVYWGQMSLVFDYQQTIQKSGLLSLSQDNVIQLRHIRSDGTEKAVIWSNSDVTLSAGVSETIDLYEATWELQMERKNGWKGTSATYWTILISGIIAAVLSASTIHNLLTSKQDLEKRIEERTESLKKTNIFLEQNMSELEESQAELTEVNYQLSHSLDLLKETQNQLIISEKLAALGELVAGIAHEINTPLGIGVTLASYIQSIQRDFKAHYTNSLLTDETIEEYLSASDEALIQLNRNLDRASSLVVSFKQLAVDQSSEERRLFVVKDIIQDTLISLQPKLKKTAVEVTVECDESLSIQGYPGAITQILTNFVINSLLHGFKNRSNGHIQIRFFHIENRFVLEYLDDGVGISEAHKDKVFNPFFSTRKSAGSTGLGLHIVHNIVTHTLHGDIQLISQKEKGVHFIIRFEE